MPEFICCVDSTGNVSVAYACGTTIRSGYSSDIIPHIVSFTPVSGKINQIITIHGNNFNSTFSDNTVFFGGVKATILSGNNSSLIVKVPAGATCQPISVLDNSTGLAGRSIQPFTYFLSACSN